MNTEFWWDMQWENEDVTLRKCKTGLEPCPVANFGVVGISFGV